MPITSQMRPVPALGEIWVGGWEAAGLLKPSAVKPVFATIERRLVVRRLGALTGVDQQALREAIASVIG